MITAIRSQIIIPARISQLTVDEAKQRLGQFLFSTAEALSEIAMIVEHLEQSGVDVTEFRSAFGGQLRLIALGRLSPRLAAKYVSSPSLVSQLSTLPLEEQERLVEGGKVEVAEWRGSSIEGRLMSLADMTPAQVRQVIGNGYIKNVEQQIPKVVEQAKRHKPKPIGVKAKPADGGITVGRQFVKREEVIRALAITAAGPESEEHRRRRSLSGIPLTDEEHEALKQHSGEAIANMLRAVGAFG